MTDDHLRLLIDDCVSIIVEAEFTSRWSLVEGYHELGKRIATDRLYKANSRELLSRVTNLTKIKERNLYRAVQFYEKFPELELLPEGKNVSWHKICNEYLPKPREEKEEPSICICPTCGREHKQAK